MQQEVYPNPEFLARRRYRICGFMDMNYGGPFVCFLWMVINMYACVLSFQDRSPIYSYLNHASLVVQGVVCLLFVISALVSFFSFTMNNPGQLRRSHRSTWIFVIAFLIIYFVNMVIFGVQKDQFLHWCISKSQTRTVQSLTINNSTTSTISGYNISDISGFVFMPINEGSDLYNCTRLWEDEMKFSVVHFAFCFWRHTQDRMVWEQQMFEGMYGPQGYNNMMMNGNMMNNPGMMMNGNPPMMMNNIKPMGEQKNIDHDGQRSLAQIARAVFGSAACIRGHRVKKCNHKDRPMIPLVKRGRQVSQCNHCRDLRLTNQSHVKCTCAIASTPNPINGCLCEVLLTCTCVASHLQDVQEDGGAYSPSPSVSCCSTSPKTVDKEISETPWESKSDPPAFNNPAFNPTNDDSVSDLFQFLENDLDKYLVRP
ncbi:hypothetical protein MFLAVUS_005305 [Mucor flavus]|uniref:Copper-fist domain-containing protein n=1 Tax=Mucor flavus TaxID=439312 RepID=A0ABP9YYB2_9FUNG